MAVEDFFSDDGKATVTRAVRDAEARTSAEVVVAVRRRSAAYVEVEAFAALGVGMVALLYVVLSPRPISTVAIPVPVVFGAAFGALLVRWLSPLKRALVPAARRLASVSLAARAAFVELGVGRTAGHTGVLVFVSAFERTVQLVGDVGVDAALLDGSHAGLARAVERWDVAAFADAVRAIGPALAAALPRAPDDTNELPDEPVTS